MRRLFNKHPVRLALGTAVVSLGLAASLFVLVQIVMANPETWYLRSAAGAACGSGVRESLNQTAGSAATTTVLNGTGDTWNRTETARTIGAGNWQVLFDAATGSGGGPGNRVTVLVERRNSDCVVQQTIINEEVDLTKGTTQEYSTATTDPGNVDFAAGDILTVTLTQTRGNQTVTLRYEGAASSDADSRLVHPDELVAVAVADIASLAESVAAALGFGRTDATTLVDSIASLVSRAPVGVTDTASILESIASLIGRVSTPFDVASIVESVVGVLGFNAADAATLAESIVSLVSRAPVAVSDTTSVLDSVASVIGRVFSPSDAASFVESVVGILGFSGTETPTLLESLAILVTRAGVGVVDSPGIADFVTVALEIRGADLAVSMADSSDPVLVEDTLTCTMLVTNTGPSLATGVVLTDSLPSGATFGAAYASQGSCSRSSATVTCNFGNIDRAANATVTLSVKPKVSAGGTIITNSVDVTANETDPKAKVSSASQDTLVANKADLVMEKSASPNGVITGEQLTYTLEVTNDGPSDATGVVATELLPSGTAFVSATSTQGTCSDSGGAVTCDLGGLASEASATVEIVVTVTVACKPNKATDIGNTASVAANEADPVGASNTATADTEVLCDDDGDGIGNQVEDSAPNSGDGDADGTKDKNQDHVTSLKNVVDERYIVFKSPTGTTLIDVDALDNPSPDDAPAGVDFPVGFFDYKLKDFAPSLSVTTYIIFPQGTIIESYWRYGPTPGDPTPHWYEFLYDGATGAVIDGSTVTLHFVDGGRGDDDLTVNGEIADAGAPIFAPADLSVTMADSPSPALAGSKLSYIVSVSNGGPSSANGVVLTDTLPADVTFDLAAPSQGSRSQASGAVTCDLGVIGTGGSATVVVFVTPLAAAVGSSVINVASVAANETDSNSTNNTAALGTMVNPTADIAVTTMDSPASVVVGNTLTYTVTVTNVGPSQATGVVLANTLPIDVNIESVAPSQGSCGEVLAGAVTCVLEALDSGASATVAIAVVPMPIAGGTVVTNTAAATADQADPELANNGASERTEVRKIVLVGPTPTPFPLLVVVPDEQITPPDIEGGVIGVVHPTDGATFAIPLRGVKLDIPAPVQQKTFQVRLEAPRPDQLDVPPEGRVLRVINIDLFDVDGSPAQDVSFWSSARLSFILNEFEIQSIGGLGAALNEFASGKLRVQRFNPTPGGGEWTDLLTSFDVAGRTFSASVSRFSTFGLVWSVEQPTPALSPTPTPTPPPADTPTPTSTPAPIATPTPTPTATLTPTPIPTALATSVPEPTVTPTQTSTPIGTPVASPTPTPLLIAELEPEATSTPPPPPQESRGGAPVLLVTGVAAAVVLVGGAVAVWARRRRAVG